MINVTILSIGRQSSAEVAKLCLNYQRRLTKIQLNWQYIPPVSGKMTRNEQRIRESGQILARMHPDDYFILLDETGHQYDNHGLVKMFNEWQGLNKNIILVIGGAFGVSEELNERADCVWSLSKLVFPHEIVRLLLCEQLYRTETIIDNLPYHHQ